MQEGVDVPKPLVRVQDEPMIERLVRVFHDCDAEEVVVVTNDLSPLTRQHLETLRPRYPRLRVVVRTTPSSMHSFHALMPLLGSGKFCLTTVDTIFRESEFHAFVHAFEACPDDGLMAVTDYIDDEKPLYVSTDPRLRITGFHDTLEAFATSSAGSDGTSVCRYISGGIYGLDDRCFATLDRCMASGVARMRNFQRQLVADGLRLTAYPFRKILDVDHAIDIAKAETFLNTPS